MFTNQIHDELVAARDSSQMLDPSLQCLGWSFSDSACSFFSALAVDSMFYHHFRACEPDSSELYSVASEHQHLFSDLSNDHVDVAAYVQSKILPSTFGSIEHTNIMYWTDRFHLSESEQDARVYDEAKRSEGRALIWPYVRSSYSDVNQFCSFISLYIFQVWLCSELDSPCFVFVLSNPSLHLFVVVLNPL
jgi:hypothetical protein